MERALLEPVGGDQDRRPDLLVTQQLVVARAFAGLEPLVGLGGAIEPQRVGREAERRIGHRRRGGDGADQMDDSGRRIGAGPSQTGARLGHGIQLPRELVLVPGQRAGAGEADQQTHRRRNQPAAICHPRLSPPAPLV